jgi:hypothetical protein
MSEVMRILSLALQNLNLLKFYPAYERYLLEECCYLTIHDLDQALHDQEDEFILSLPKVVKLELIKVIEQNSFNTIENKIKLLAKSNMKKFRRRRENENKRSNPSRVEEARTPLSNQRNKSVENEFNFLARGPHSTQKLHRRDADESSSSINPTSPTQISTKEPDPSSLTFRSPLPQDQVSPLRLTLHNSDLSPVPLVSPSQLSDRNEQPEEDQRSPPQSPSSIRNIGLIDLTSLSFASLLDQEEEALQSSEVQSLPHGTGLLVSTCLAISPLESTEEQLPAAQNLEAYLKSELVTREIGRVSESGKGSDDDQIVERQSPSLSGTVRSDEVCGTGDGSQLVSELDERDDELVSSEREPSTAPPRDDPMATPWVPTISLSETTTTELFETTTPLIVPRSQSGSPASEVDRALDSEQVRSLQDERDNRSHSVQNDEGSLDSHVNPSSTPSRVLELEEVEEVTEVEDRIDAEPEDVMEGESQPEPEPKEEEIDEVDLVLQLLDIRSPHDVNDQEKHDSALRSSPPPPPKPYISKQSSSSYPLRQRADQIDTLLDHNDEEEDRGGGGEGQDGEEGHSEEEIELDIQYDSPESSVTQSDFDQLSHFELSHHQESPLSQSHTQRPEQQEMEPRLQPSLIEEVPYTLSSFVSEEVPHEATDVNPPVEEEDDGAGHWAVYLSDEGFYYHYNDLTEESTWHCPLGLYLDSNRDTEGEDEFRECECISSVRHLYEESEEEVVAGARVATSDQGSDRTREWNQINHQGGGRGREQSSEPHESDSDSTLSSIDQTREIRVLSPRGGGVTTTQRTTTPVSAVLAPSTTPAPTGATTAPRREQTIDSSHERRGGEVDDSPLAATSPDVDTGATAEGLVKKPSSRWKQIKNVLLRR